MLRQCIFRKSAHLFNRLGHIMHDFFLETRGPTINCVQVAQLTFFSAKYSTKEINEEKNSFKVEQKFLNFTEASNMCASLSFV